jgi:hypothetical protein
VRFDVAHIVLEEDFSLLEYEAVLLRMYTDGSEKRATSIQKMKIQMAGSSDTSVYNYRHSVTFHKGEIFRHKRVL